jgi:hypothetical protein
MGEGRDELDEARTSSEKQRLVWLGDLQQLPRYSPTLSYLFALAQQWQHISWRFRITRSNASTFFCLKDSKQCFGGFHSAHVSILSQLASNASGHVYSYCCRHAKRRTMKIMSRRSVAPNTKLLFDTKKNMKPDSQQTCCASSKTTHLRILLIRHSSFSSNLLYLLRIRRGRHDNGEHH